MRSGVRSSNEAKDYGDDEQGPNQCDRDGKVSDSKTTTTRSKHSVTEQRRRSKINERFQRLRGLIPNSDQKRDTASFLLEVIDYVQYLQGEVQKYEGTYQQWGSEPTKLMPWRNSHLRTQSIAPQPMGNGVGAGFTPKFADSSQSLFIGHPHEFGEPEALTDPTVKTMDQQLDLAHSAMPMSMPMQEFSLPPQSDSLVSHQPLSDSQAVDPSLIGTVSQTDGLVIEEGTISVSSAYSQGLLHTLTDALQRAGVDLSQANISVQIDLGKRANRGTSTVEDYSNMPSTHQQPSSGNKDSEQTQKRAKTQN